MNKSVKIILPWGEGKNDIYVPKHSSLNIKQQMIYDKKLYLWVEYDREEEGVLLLVYTNNSKNPILDNDIKYSFNNSYGVLSLHSNIDTSNIKYEIL